MIRKIQVFILAVLLLVPSVSAFAQTDAPSNVSSLSKSIGTNPTGAPDGLSSCFLHYRFGSVPAIIATTLKNGYQDGTMGFTGSVINENEYPIVDATVWVKIFHKRDTQDANAPDVVDFFPALEHVTLKAKESVPLAFSWKIPADIEPGEYQAATYVTSSDRFELLGLSFTDDVIGNIAEFSIGGEKIGAVRFAKDGVTVAGKPFTFAAFPPKLPTGTKEVPVSARIVNTTTTPLETTVTWSVYYWDALQKEHLLDTKSETITVSASSTITTSIIVKDTEHSVYFIKGVVTSKHGASSIIGVRFVRSDVNEPRFNFVAVDNGTAIACIHSTGTGPAQNGEVLITVTKDVWYSPVLRLFNLGTLASASYKGAIPGEIYALSAPLVGKGTSYTIKAELLQEGKMLDTVSLSYTCKDTGTPCPSVLIRILVLVVPILIFGILGYVSVLLYRKRKAKKAQQALSWNNPPAS